jgi:ribosomal protection tetracycline resistance protein
VTQTLNLGVLAHVDAGKTSLTERLLYVSGVIERIGSVDEGNTQTDTLALERQRGITIKSAVAAFRIGDRRVNLIDTPGHPDFVAEVERVLSVLDGTILVISAVEGVQSQTVSLFRVVQRLKIPTIIFVNKIDRRGAQQEALLAAIRERLTAKVVVMGSCRKLGEPDAEFELYGVADPAFIARLTEFLADHDDRILAAYVDGKTSVPYHRLRAALRRLTTKALAVPIFFGSAKTGVGIDALMAGLVEWLPSVEGSADKPPSGNVFKIERAPAGEKVAYVRMFSGSIRVRSRLEYGNGHNARVTGISVFDAGAAVPRSALSAGEIGRISGLTDAKIGDTVGVPRSGPQNHQFASPTLETVIEPTRVADRGALYTALDRLAEEDPLIDVRHDDRRQEVYISLYGEVQKEVIEETLRRDFGIGVSFRDTTIVCIERLIGAGEAFEVLRQEPNPFLATIGLRIEPGAPESGVQYRREVSLGSMPLAFHRAVEETVHDTLQQGLYGWSVTDCIVTMTHSGYLARQSHSHAVFDKSMSSTAGDFRNLTPLILMNALKQAGTVVCEPIHAFRLEIPPDTLGTMLPMLKRVDATLERQSAGASCVLEGRIRAEQLHTLQQRLPALTRGEGILETTFASYQPVRGAPPTRRRTDNNPLDREEYLLRLSRRI